MNDALLNNQVNLIEQAIDDLDLNSASQLLDDFLPKNNIERRIKGHLQGKIKFRDSNFNEAFEIFQTVISNYGPHVNLIADLACAHYFLGENYKWNNTVDFLSLEYDRSKNLLSLKTCQRIELILAKFKEEQGNLGPALKIYKSLEEEALDNNEMYPIVLAQLLRFKSYWNITEDLSKYYRKLLLISGKDFSNHANIEVQHALLLAELELFSFEVASTRVNFIINNERINSADACLILFDYLEYCLLNSLLLPVKILCFIQKAGSTDHYEKLLLKIYNEKKDFDFNQQLGNIKNKVSTASFIKLLFIASNQTKQKNKQNFITQANYLLKSFDYHTETIWQKKYLQELSNTDFEPLELVVDVNQKKLFCNSSAFDLSRKTNLLNCLILLAKHREVSLAGLVNSVWNMEYNISFYDRIRMMIKRFNKLFEGFNGHNKIIEVTSENILLLDNITLKIKH